MYKIAMLWEMPPFWEVDLQLQVFHLYLYRELKIEQCVLKVDKSYVAENQANYGGALLLSLRASATLNQTFIQDNIATHGSVGFSYYGGFPELIDSNITYNFENPSKLFASGKNNKMIVDLQYRGESFSCLKSSKSCFEWNCQ